MTTLTEIVKQSILEGKAELSNSDRNAIIQDLQRIVLIRELRRDYDQALASLNDLPKPDVPADTIVALAAKEGLRHLDKHQLIQLASSSASLTRLSATVREEMLEDSAPAFWSAAYSDEVTNAVREGGIEHIHEETMRRLKREAAERRDR
jgi:hypothetical protein